MGASLAGRKIAAGLQRSETLTRGCYLEGDFLVVREAAGDKYSSLRVLMSDVRNKLVEAEEMLVLALQRSETLTRGWYLDGGWMVMRQEAGDKYSSLMVSMSDVHDRLVEAEEMLVLA